MFIAAGGTEVDRGTDEGYLAQNWMIDPSQHVVDFRLRILQRLGKGFDRSAQKVLFFQLRQPMVGRIPCKRFAENPMKSRFVFTLAW